MNKVPFYILCAILLCSHSALAQEATPAIVAYTYDAAGNRTAAVTTPGYLEAEPTALLPKLSKSSAMDELVAKSRAEYLSPGNRIHSILFYAVDDRKGRRGRQIKEEGPKQ